MINPCICLDITSCSQFGMIKEHLTTLTNRLKIISKFNNLTKLIELIDLFYETKKVID